MTPMFDDVTPTDAEALVSPPEWLDANRAFLGVPTEADGDPSPDHWQNGDGLSAPLPSQADPNYSVYADALERTFVVEDCLSDVVERRRGGLLGKEPQWTFEREEQPVDGAGGEVDGDEPDGAVDPVLDRITAAMSEWWDEVGAHERLREFADGLAYGGRSYLRLFVPPGRLDYGEDGEPRVTAATPEEALRLVHVEHLDPDQAVVHVDRDTRLPLGVVLFEVEADTAVTADGRPRAVTEVEMVYPETAEPDARTVIRTVREGGADSRLVLDLRGKLTLHEGRSRPLVDAHMRKNQIDLNTARTMLAISNHKTGFPSLVFINVRPPTENVGGEEVPASYENGPGQVGFFTTFKEESDAQGRRRFTPGSVTQFEPVDNTNLRESADVARVAIYRRAKQLHVLAMKGANLSGDAMVQAQGEYLQDLLDQKAVIDRAGKWLLETAWAFAEVLSGQDAPTKDVRAVFDCRVNAGPLSSAMRQAILDEYREGVISRQTAQSLLGVDDVEAEGERLREEAEEGITLKTREGAALFGGFGEAGFTPASGDGLPGDVDVNANPAE